MIVILNDYIRGIVVNEESFGLAAVEDMFCDLPVNTTKTGIFWDWESNVEKPRKSAFEKN